MSTFVFANNVSTSLASAISPTATTIALASSTNLPTITPGDYFPLTLNDKLTGNVYEIVYVTAITGASLTVIRGQEGTTAQSWVVGDYAYGAFTAGTVLTVNNTYIQNPMTAAGDLITGGTGGTPSRLGIGADDQVLTVVGGVPVWETLPDAGMTNPMTASGDIITGGTGGTPSRLAKGADGSVLSLVAGAPAWVASSVALFTTLTDQTANRALGTTYTNTSGKPIFVIANISVANASYGYAYVDSNNYMVQNTGGYTGLFALSFMVPAGSTYKCTGSSISKWFEVS